MASVACGALAHQPSEVAAGDAQNGGTVTLAVGDFLEVTLGSTAWTFAPSPDSSILLPQGEQAVSPAPRGQCFPGMSCGTTSARFKALKTGSTTISASRVSCGEARRCVGAEGQFQLTVVVG
jgi:hypothetical protein